MSPRGDDEHMTLPTWRVRQLQDVEHAARECVELIRATPSPKRADRADVVAEVKALLEDALGD